MSSGESSTLRAFKVLELVAGAKTPPTLDELTRASGLPKPTVFRILGLLARGGFIQRLRGGMPRMQRPLFMSFQPQAPCFICRASRSRR